MTVNLEEDVIGKCTLEQLVEIVDANVEIQYLYDVSDDVGEEAVRDRIETAIERSTRALRAVHLNEEEITEVHEAISRASDRWGFVRQPA